MMQQTLLVQTLVVRGGQVLLGRWRPGSGPFAGRVTGMLGSVVSSRGKALPSPESAASTICSQLLGPKACVASAMLRRRAFFEFTELDIDGGAAAELGARYGEHQMLLKLCEGDKGTFEPEMTETFEPIGWFNSSEIPYDEMPEDDKVWYERVVFEGQRLRGNFTFKGTTLVDHSLQEVDASAGLCDLDFATGAAVNLLIHNPSCSKSAALRESLIEKGESFVERRYLDEPLSLSELETLLARIKASSAEQFAGQAAKTLCRDPEFVGTLFKRFSPGDAEDRILERIALHPELLQRPVLVRGQTAAIVRQ
eukprot:TRINITY_DN56961_c0_g1_i1.p1 TRINITY_DN56961_c0_g1~~TRINITY_DN56961_c0_g1_i1.p1  ORF type:complete len:329 (+),score=63.84 TRINITY_DN56961_c0_g1_i1:58-987(+)